MRPVLRSRIAPASSSHYDLSPVTDNEHLRNGPKRVGHSEMQRPFLSAALEPADIARSDPDPHRMLGLSDLKHQIDVLSAEIEAFGAERDALEQVLREARPQVCLMFCVLCLCRFAHYSWKLEEPHGPMTVDEPPPPMNAHHSKTSENENGAAAHGDHGHECPR